MADDVSIRPRSPMYSLHQIVGEAGMTGPRWKLHLIKLAQHAAPAFAVLCLTQLRHAVLIAAIAGPIAYLLVVTQKLWRARNVAPGFFGDFVSVHYVDWVFDSSFAFATLAGGYIAIGDWIGGGLLLAGCVSLYLALHTQGDP